MNAFNNNTSIIEQLIKTCRKGFFLLNEESKSSLIKFIRSQQHLTGLFIDRGQKPDIYYSLFGYWLLQATELEQESQKLKDSLNNSLPQTNGVNALCAQLIVSHQQTNKLKTPFFFFTKSLIQLNKGISFVYKLFMFDLWFNQKHKNSKRTKYLLKFLSYIIPVKASAPCSIISAQSILYQLAGRKNTLTPSLMHYYNHNGGFKAFKENHKADMLSTAVALFALKSCNENLANIKPQTLEFIGENFHDGAFLSGNGDTFRDIEYTFYGLLALGSLSTN